MSLVLSVLTPLCVLLLALALPALHQVHYVCDVTGPWCLPRLSTGICCLHNPQQDWREQTLVREWWLF